MTSPSEFTKPVRDGKSDPEPLPPELVLSALTHYTELPPAGQVAQQNNPFTQKAYDEGGISK